MRSIVVVLCSLTTLAALMETGYAAVWSQQKSKSVEIETTPETLDKNQPWGKRFDNLFRQEGEDLAIALLSLGNLTLASVIQLTYEGSDVFDALNKGQLPAPKRKTLRTLRKINHEHFSKMRKIINDLVSSTLWNIEEIVDLFFDGWEALSTEKGRGHGDEKKPGNWQDIINGVMNSFIQGLAQPTNRIV